MIFSPVRLQEDAVDLLEVDDASLVAHGLQERSQAQIAGATQEAIAGTDDQGEGFLGEGVDSLPAKSRSGQRE
jgi:hypothetical protein